MNRALLNIISLNKICLSDFDKIKHSESIIENSWMWDNGTNILWDNGDVISISENGWMWDDSTNILWDNNNVILI